MIETKYSDNYGHNNIIYAYILFCSFYLSFGNVLRFIPMAKSGSGVLLTEVLFYLFSIVYFVIKIKSISIPKYIYIFTILIILSVCVGGLKNGIDVSAEIYSVRLCMQILSVQILGHALYNYYRADAGRAIIIISVIPIIVSSAIGWGLLIAFPNAVQLWAALQSAGISFAGDPHSHRLLSSYFDPNLYSSICVFGILSASIFIRSKALNAASIVFLLISLLYTKSRSGLVGVVILYLFGMLTINKKIIINKKTFYTSVAVIVCVVSLYDVYSTPLLETLSRLMGTSSSSKDISSLARLYNFSTGKDIFLDNFWFGIGYNYIEKYYSFGSFFDSSILTIFVTFGAVSGIIILLFLIKYIFSVFNSHIFRDDIMRRYRRGFIVYLLIIMFFASNFNNLFFYQFWYVNVFAVINYFYYRILYTKGAST